MRYCREFVLPGAMCLAMVLAAVSAVPAAAKGEEAGPREQYENALSYAERGKYRTASKLLERFVEGYPGSPLAPEAKFRQAECLELMKKYYAAFRIYQELLEQYPTFPSTAEVLHRQLTIGTTLLNRKGLLGGNVTRAREIFRKVVHNAPFGESAPRAQFNLARTYEMRKSYSEAVIEYGKVISNYPGSDAVDDADFHLALCHYKKAKRAPHDQAASAKALTALKGFLQRYPSNPKAPEAKAMEEEIAGRKAQALFDIAEYYEKTGSPKSAIYYYQEIIDEYPGLELARRAELKVKRDFELAQVDKRIEKLTEELDTIKDEIAYSKRQVKKLRRPEPAWHVWKYLGSPGGAKGERIAQEKERIASLGKEAGEKKREIRAARKERREVHRITAARLVLDRAKWKKQLAEAELAAARDDRPGVEEEGEADAAALKSYEKEIRRKSAAAERAARSVKRAEKRLESVRAGIEDARVRAQTRASRKTRVRKEDLREREYREKMAELSSALRAERDAERGLAREEKRQKRQLRRVRRTGGPGEAAEAEAALSLLSSRRGKSLEKIAKLEREIERRRRIRELQGLYEEAMKKERRAESELLEVEADSLGRKGGFFSFMRGDPLTGAVEELDRCKRRRRRLEEELSALVSGKEYLDEKEKSRAERERLEREKRAAAEKRDLERVEKVVRARAEKEEARRARAKKAAEEKKLKRAGRERRAAEKAREREKAEREKEEARRREREAREEAAAARRRGRLREQLSEALEREEAAADRLEELREEKGEGPRRVWLFFTVDPVKKAERKLEILRRRREELERKLEGEGGTVPSPAGT